jgi:hypothetical protein
VVKLCWSVNFSLAINMISCNVFHQATMAEYQDLFVFWYALYFQVKVFQLVLELLDPNHNVFVWFWMTLANVLQNALCRLQPILFVDLWIVLHDFVNPVFAILFLLHLTIVVLGILFFFLVETQPDWPGCRYPGCYERLYIDWNFSRILFQ